MSPNLHREIDIGQGALRKAGVPKSERKKLRREAKKFMRPTKRRALS